MTEDFRGLRDLLAAAVEDADEKARSDITGDEFDAWWNRRLEARRAIFAALPGLLERIDKLETGISKEVEGMRKVAAIEIDHGSSLHGHLLNEYAIQLAALLSPADPPKESV